MAEADIDELFDRLFGRTFGRNLSEIRDVLGGQWSLADQLGAALRLWNDLVHHWMRDRALQQGTRQKRQAMIEELDAAIEQLEAVNTQLTEQALRTQAENGVSRAVVDAEYERLTRIAESDGDPSSF